MSDDFLSRWSRRKRAAPEAPEEPAPPEAAPDSPEPELKDDAALLAAQGLKDPDEMGPGDDFAAFLRAALPQHLKTRALRRLWRSNPALACLDGLNDYDGDFTATGVPEGGLRTAYQVGRGFARRIKEEVPEREEDPADEAEVEVEVAAAADTDPRPDEGHAPAGVNAAIEADEASGPQGPTRRRMSFRT